jgi:antiviral helicase SKI2
MLISMLTSIHADHCLHLERAAGGGGGGGSSSERAQLQDLIQLLRKRDLLPVAFFTFSKKRCDSAADACSGLDLTTSAEKHTVHVFVQQVLSRLREGDRELPQVR